MSHECLLFTEQVRGKLVPLQEELRCKSASWMKAANMISRELFYKGHMRRLHTGLGKGHYIIGCMIHGLVTLASSKHTGYR